MNTKLKSGEKRTLENNLRRLLQYERVSMSGLSVFLQFNRSLEDRKKRDGKIFGMRARDFYDPEKLRLRDGLKLLRTAYGGKMLRIWKRNTRARGENPEYILGKWDETVTRLAAIEKALGSKS